MLAGVSNITKQNHVNMVKEIELIKHIASREIIKMILDNMHLLYVVKNRFGYSVELTAALANNSIDILTTVWSGMGYTVIVGVDVTYDGEKDKAKVTIEIKSNNNTIIKVSEYGEEMRYINGDINEVSVRTAVTRAKKRAISALLGERLNNLLIFLSNKVSKIISSNKASQEDAMKIIKDMYHNKLRNWYEYKFKELIRKIKNT